MASPTPRSSALAGLLALLVAWMSPRVATAQLPEPALPEPAPPEPAPPEPAPTGAITPPELTRYVSPAYPPAEKEAGREAAVILYLVVDADGRVAKAEVAESGGDAFDAAALAAAPGLRFTPARDAEGRPFKARIKFRYAFVLTPAPEPEVTPEPAAVEPPEPAAEIPSPGVIDVTVEGDPPREVTRRRLERREVARIPGTNGDLLRSLESLPGVARPPAILGALFVRGSSPFDSSVYIDGVLAPLVYHFGGLSSVVPTEMIDRLDFYPGNFSVRYGRAMGGIVDVSLRLPDPETYHGLLQIDLIDARLFVEGPIPYLDGWSFAVAARRSWLDAWLGAVLKEVGASVTQAPRYWDYQLMIAKRWDRGRFRLAFYGSDDTLEILSGEPPAFEPVLSGNLSYATNFQRLHAGLEMEAAEGTELDFEAALTHDIIGFSLGSIFFEAGGHGFSSRGEVKQALDERVKLVVGGELQLGPATVKARIPGANRPGEPQNQPFSTSTSTQGEDTRFFLRPALYAEAQLRPVDRWSITPGIRFDYFLGLGLPTVDPRLSTRVDLVSGFPRTTLKGGVGIFHQPPNFQEYIEPFGNPDIDSNVAIHYGLGLEQDITEHLFVSAEGFFKQLDSLVTPQASASGNYVDYVNTGSGEIVGGELLLKYQGDEHFFGWVAYTLSRSSRRNAPGEESYLVSWDQTHILTVLGSYRLGNGWELGARFRLVSGNLITPDVCDPADAACDPLRVNALFHGASGAYTPLSGVYNDERLPTFHALDLRVDKTWRFPGWKLATYLDLRNAYNNRNAEALTFNYAFTQRGLVPGLPIVPSLGIRGEL